MSGRGPRRSSWRGRHEAGQATVEFIVVFPALVLAVLLVLQVLVLGRDYLTVTNVARESARAAAVDRTDQDAFNLIATQLPRATLQIRRVGGIGSPVTARVRYQARTSLPIIGVLLPDVWLEQSVTMRAEQ